MIVLGLVEVDGVLWERRLPAACAAMCDGDLVELCDGGWTVSVGGLNGLGISEKKLWKIHGEPEVHVYLGAQRDRLNEGLAATLEQNGWRKV